MLLAWNTLEEAATYLSSETNNNWTTREVIQASLDNGVSLHIQILTDRSDLWQWMREGEMAELPFNLDILRFLGGEGSIQFARHNNLLYKFTPGIKAELEHLRLSKAALQTLLTAIKEKRNGEQKEEILTSNVAYPKDYYRMNEAVDYLTSELRRNITVENILYVAMFGDIRLCKWFDSKLFLKKPGRVKKTSSQSNIKPTLFPFKGFLQVPEEYITPMGDIVKCDELIAWHLCKRGIFIEAQLNDGYYFVSQAANPDSYIFEPNYQEKGIPELMQFEVNLNDCMIPEQDLFGYVNSVKNQQVDFQQMGLINEHIIKEDFKTDHIKSHKTATPVPDLRKNTAKTQEFIPDNQLEAELKTQTISDAASNNEIIPGKIPRTGIGKLAIKAAFEIERETGKLASANQVMDKLHKWIETEAEPILLEKEAYGVIWMTTNQQEARFTIEACGKALKKWNEGRE